SLVSVRRPRAFLGALYGVRAETGSDLRGRHVFRLHVDRTYPRIDPPFRKSDPCGAHTTQRDGRTSTLSCFRGQMIASLPMYDLPEVKAATDAWWRGLARHIGIAGVLDRGRDRLAPWRSPDLVFS